jgi:hypothetical protein
MRYGATLALAGLLTTTLPPAQTWACGDKLLLAGRDYPYSRGYAAIHPASIVIYLPKAAKSRDAGSGLASMLKRAGHDTQVIADATMLARSLHSGQVDVVLANIIDIPDAEAASSGVQMQPVLMPVLFDASAANLEAATRRYGYALKDRDTASRFLGTIDQAMASRPSHASRRKH